jgi:hypothetical protein
LGFAAKLQAFFAKIGLEMLMQIQLKNQGPSVLDFISV